MPTAAALSTDAESQSFRHILGIRFFVGGATEAVDRMTAGGLLVVPAAPALKDLSWNEGYREALLNADLTITDSSFMVLIWNVLQRDRIRRLSGLTYLRELLNREELRSSGSVLWIMPTPRSTARNLNWLRSHRINVSSDDVYVAPMYGPVIEDNDLLAKLQLRQPRHIIIAIGGGTQERLGLYLKRNLNYNPAIHCIGAAIAFLSGDQVRIPDWADKLYLGWLFRCLSEPSRYVTRYWQARKLLPLMIRYRGDVPRTELR